MASAVSAWSVTGAASVFAADPAAVTTLDDAPRYAIGLATAAFLVVLLLVLRMSRVRGRAGSRADEPDDATVTPSVPTSGRPEEAHLPRWRRPSVVAGRFGLSLPGATRTDRLAFEPAFDEPGERFVIRYDSVPLVDQPDDVHGRTIDELSAGDEVEVVDRQTLWVHVRTPAGRVGWVPAMTLATLDELPPEIWEVAAEPADAPPIEPGPPLEALLEAIVAERRTLNAPAMETAASTNGSSPAEPASPATEPRPKRVRAPRQPGGSTARAGGTAKSTAKSTATSRASSRRKAASSES